MAKDNILEKFYQDLNQEIYNKASIDEVEDFRENVFTQIYIDDLCEAAEIEDGNIAFHEARGVKINAYSMPEDESSLDLFVSIYKNSPELFTVPPSEAINMINRLKQFYLKSVKGYYTDIEEAYGAFDIAHSIYELAKGINTVRLFLLTNGTVRSTIIEPEIIDGVTFIPAIWDLERIHRVITSGNAREKIDFDLIEIAGKTLDAIKVEIPEVISSNGLEKSGGYTSYFTVFPGDVLFNIYERYNTRLLEKNVRAFLQARGGVNKGLKSTILECPEMFLAYNNGISATAEAITLKNVDGNKCTITGIKDFQIVNGGQTTASIFTTCIKNKEPLDKVYVQAKITVVDDQDTMDIVVPRISQYANTQNKVQMADFSANDEFHQAVEALSRTVWAPAKTGGEQQTKWFYERARGQYADIRSREKNKKYFDSIYPKKQYFDKLQLARYENVWDQLPYIASRGGQTSFREFTLRLKKRGKYVPEQEYYQYLIAKAILYREVKSIVRKQGFQGYWANVTDYTFAYLSYKTAQRIDLSKIWKAQAVSSELKLSIETISIAVYKYITESANGQNVSQWCKKEECWKGLKTKEIDVNITSDDTVVLGNKTKVAEKQNIEAATSIENELVNAIKEVDGDTWFAIASWGKETGNLQGYQNGISGTLGKYKGWNKEPSYKQARQAIKILGIAYEKGFMANDKIVEKVIKKYAEGV